MKKYSPQELIDFETKVAETFNSGVIKSPVHLYDGNEEQIINVFEKIKDPSIKRRNSISIFREEIKKDNEKED